MLQARRAGHRQTVLSALGFLHRRGSAQHHPPGNDHACQPQVTVCCCCCLEPSPHPQPSIPSPPGLASMNHSRGAKTQTKTGGAAGLHAQGRCGSPPKSKSAKFANSLTNLPHPTFPLQAIFSAAKKNTCGQLPHPAHAREPVQLLDHIATHLPHHMLLAPTILSAQHQRRAGSEDGQPCSRGRGGDEGPGGPAAGC